MNSPTPSLPGQIDIELPLADSDAIAHDALTLATVAGRGGAFAGAFAPTLSQVAAYPQGRRDTPTELVTLSA